MCISVTVFVHVLSFTYVRFSMFTFTAVQVRANSPCVRPRVQQAMPIIVYIIACGKKVCHYRHFPYIHIFIIMYQLMLRFLCSYIELKQMVLFCFRTPIVCVCVCVCVWHCKLPPCNKPQKQTVPLTVLNRMSRQNVARARVQNLSRCVDANVVRVSLCFFLFCFHLWEFSNSDTPATQKTFTPPGGVTLFSDSSL